MQSAALEKCTLFRGISPDEVRSGLESVPHAIRQYERGEAVFRMLENADRIGILLEGRVQAQKSFPNGSRINVTVRLPGEMIGPAAVFSSSHVYPCDMVALEHTCIMMFKKEDILHLMHRDIRLLQNFISEIATAADMLQQRAELLSYSGIAQKAAFYLLIHARRSGKKRIGIPGSVSNWAMVMNVSRPSLHRELRKMESGGIIKYSPPVIVILDLDRLQALLDK